VTLPQLLPRLLASWRSEGHPCGNPSASRLLAFEARRHAPLPRDLRALYELVDGMEDGLFRLWSLDEIEAESPEWDAPDHLLFGDYLMNSHAYGLAGDGHVDLIGGPLPLRVASSFAEFWSFYLDERHRLFM
jgi:hypothetical protein